MTMTNSILELEKILVDAVKRLDIDMFNEFSIHVQDFKNFKKQYFITHMTINHILVLD